MKTILALTLLAFSAAAQISNDSSANIGSSTTGTLSASYTNNGTWMYACVEGDNEGGADDVQLPTYAGDSSHTYFLAKVTSGAPFTTRNLYAYALNVSSHTGSNTFQVTSTTAHYLAAVVSSYKHAGVVGTVAGAYTGFAPSGAAQGNFTTAMTPHRPGSWELLCDGGISPSNVGPHNTLRVGSGPTIFDSNTALNQLIYWPFTTNTFAEPSDTHIQVEISSDTPTFGVLQSSVRFTNANPWVWNGSDIGLNSCNFFATTITADGTGENNFPGKGAGPGPTPVSTVCDATTHNVTVTWSTGTTHTGVIVIVPNPSL